MRLPPISQETLCSRSPSSSWSLGGKEPEIAYGSSSKLVTSSPMVGIYILDSASWKQWYKCTVINAFGGLVILHAIAGNITSYSRKMYGQLKSLL